MDLNNIDFLTNTLNRSGLFSEYSKITESNKIQILFFDLDNFKTINDMYGHHEGDEALKLFSKLLLANTPDNSYVSRIGGDEFVTIIPYELNCSQIISISQKILEATKALRNINHIYEVLSCSVGILNDYEVDKGLDTALSLADKALYHSKEAGRDTYTFYNDIKSQILHEKNIETKAVAAIANDKFKVMYHPVLHLHSSELIRSEACCLWLQEDGTYLGRNDFRPILEKNGLIKEIDLLIFEKV